jgi:hypothetical protein
MNIGGGGGGGFRPRRLHTPRRPRPKWARIEKHAQSSAQDVPNAAGASGGNHNTAAGIAASTANTTTQPPLLLVPVTIADEEVIMRLWMWRIQVQQRIQRAQETAWTAMVTALEPDMVQFLSVNNSTNGGTTTTTTNGSGEEESPTKKARLSVPAGDNKEDKDDFSRYCLPAAPTTSFPPSLLPLIVLQSTAAIASIVDRRAILTTLVAYWKKQYPQTAMVHLPRLVIDNHTNTNNGLTGSLELLVQQCLAQETHPLLQKTLQKRLVQRKQKQHASSLTDILLQWAKHTLSHKSIVVCLEVRDITCLIEIVLGLL